MDPIDIRSIRRSSNDPCINILVLSTLLLISHASYAQDGSAVRKWASYHGGSGADAVLSMATDLAGNIYVAGRTTEGLLLSNDTTANSVVVHQNSYGGGASDAFLAKIGSHGSMLWCTFFGGGGDDEAVEVVVAATDSIYLIGNTTSTDSIATDTLAFQGVHGGGSDVFLAHFGSNGTLRSASYFGTAENEIARSAAMDVHGRLLIGGTTNGPGSLSGLTPSAQSYTQGIDGLLLLFAGTDSLVAATFIGGEGDDEIVAMANGDSTGTVFVGNTTSTTNIAMINAGTPTLQGGLDAFVMKVDTMLLIVEGTYHGGPEDDIAHDIAVQRGVPAICGTTWSEQLHTDTTSFQPLNAGEADGFFTVLDSTLAISWGTLFGGADFDSFHAVASDIDGRWYISGTARSDELTIEDSGPVGQPIGTSDMIILRFDSTRAVEWSRYLGGDGEEEALAMAVFGRTHVHIGGITDSGSGFSLLGHQMQPGGGVDGCSARLDLKESTPPIGIGGWGGGGSGGGGNGGGGGGGTTPPPPPPFIDVCLGDPITMVTYGGALGTGASWRWYSNECGVPEHYITSGDTITLWPTASFRLFVRAEYANSASTCRFVDVNVHIPPDPTVTIPDTVCAGSGFMVDGLGATTFSWLLGDSLYEGTNIVLPAPLSPGIHGIGITATEGACVVPLTDSIAVVPIPAANWSVQDISCHGMNDGAIELIDSLVQALQISWEDPDLEGSSISGLAEGPYAVTLTDTLGCQRTDTLVIIMPSALVDSIGTTTATCGQPNGTAQAFGSVDPSTLTYLWLPDSSFTSMVNELAPGLHVLSVQDSAGCLEEHPVLIADSGSVQAIIIADTLGTEDGPALLICTVIPADSAATYSWQPTIWLEDPTASSTWCEPLDTTTYVVTVTSTLGCTSADSVVVLPKPIFQEPGVRPCGEAFLPDIFSPNGDGLNDGLCLLGGCVTRLDLRIYDRWGGLVFHGSEADACWDGTAKGAPLPSGPYVFTLSAERSFGDPIERTGTILLRR